MLNNIRIVLVETFHPGNIGAAARALKNMGLGQLWYKRLLEGAISDLDFQDSMTDEAQTLHQQNRIPLSEVIKLESL